MPFPYISVQAIPKGIFDSELNSRSGTNVHSVFFLIIIIIFFNELYSGLKIANRVV